MNAIKYFHYSLVSLSNVKVRPLSVPATPIDFIVNALLEKGYIKAERFKNSKNKMGYMYILTPKGVSERFQLTQAFLARKSMEFELLRR